MKPTQGYYTRTRGLILARRRGSKPVGTARPQAPIKPPLRLPMLRPWLPGSPLGHYPVGFLRKPIECPHFLSHWLLRPNHHGIYAPFYEGPNARQDWPRKVVFR